MPRADRGLRHAAEYPRVVASNTNKYELERTPALQREANEIVETMVEVGVSNAV